MANYTYVDFSLESVKLALGETIENFDRDRFVAKAQALHNSKVKESETAKLNPKKKVAKGESADTKQFVDGVFAKLTKEFQTAADMGYNDKGDNLKVARVALREGVEKGQVVRSVKDNKGLTNEKLYAAYKLA
jgi:hypothetical protein